jgi:hypothetical protein
MQTTYEHYIEGRKVLSKFFLDVMYETEGYIQLAEHRLQGWDAVNKMKIGFHSI